MDGNFISYDDIEQNWLRARVPHWISRECYWQGAANVSPPQNLQVAVQLFLLNAQYKILAASK